MSTARESAHTSTCASETHDDPLNPQQTHGMHIATLTSTGKSRGRPVRTRSFDDFWQRKHRRLVSTVPRQNDWYFRIDPADPLDARRQYIEWVNATYAGAVPTTEYDLGEITSFIHCTVDASRSAGHRTDRMWFLIPVAVHRIWCQNLVTTADANGWPTINGVGVRADVWTEPPAVWLPGEPLVHLNDDAILVGAKNFQGPVATRYLLPAGSSPAAHAIYSQLRNDGWTRRDAEEAARLLDLDDQVARDSRGDRSVG